MLNKTLCIAVLFCFYSVAQAQEPLAPLPPENTTPPETAILDSKFRITTGSGVNLRSQPSSRSRVIAKLPIGVSMRQLNRSEEPVAIGDMAHYWYEVSLNNGQQGWIYGALTMPSERSQLRETYRILVTERLQEELDFRDQVELTRLLQRLADSADEENLIAEFKLAHLQSLHKSLMLLSQADPEEPPYSDWLEYLSENFDDASSMFGYDEIQGVYRVYTPTFWQLHETYTEQPISEQIAWTAANHPRGGECEGFISCYLAEMMNNGTGRYLQVYPDGEYSEVAMKEIMTFLSDSATLTLEDQDMVLEQLGLLEEALQASSNGLKQDALQQLNTLRQRAMS